MADHTGRLLEICVDSAEGLAAAIEGGADRIELCSALGVGGLMPSYGLMQHAKRTSPIPVYPLIRPRAGNFIYDEADVAIMEADIAQARELGLPGVVIGATTKDGRLDRQVVERLIEAASGLDISLHRAFDMVRDPIEALETAIDLGISRILTSGCAKNVSLGMEMLKRLSHQADGRISIMPGGGVTADLVPELLVATGIHEIHASGSASSKEDHSLVEFGFAPEQRRQTSPQVIRALKTIVLEV
ncbi:copper homeostasis protein CutC [Rhizobium rhizogenes]|uniref:PF03932 family protein CutC n=1 Tax=Rhizobium rhizogenes TaxID=359 RepID=A0AA92H9T3_RHIRH|nr:copper homeostasis protein CutC [Rhizobium rhizogenes]PVE55258.1 copper homeostasis protein CutC [Rhizobium rhizogenes]PVE65820.1 copper homeostasis protein CutC [Agrobacterium tumefaciens]PVE75884.1 copper homeostasis protein CutC [Sphingomonas sp. TPD3009]